MPSLVAHYLPARPRRTLRVSELVELCALLLCVLLGARIVAGLLGIGSSAVGQGLELLTWPLSRPFDSLLPSFSVGNTSVEPAAAIATCVVMAVSGLLARILDRLRIRALHRRKDAHDLPSVAVVS